MADIVYKIYPSIGVARVGDAPDESFIGPEIPGQRPERTHKVDGRVRRQAARFRVFAFENRGGRLGPGREVRSGVDGVVRVEWTVHLANRKADFFGFNGLRGEPGKYHDGVDMAPEHRRNRERPGTWAIDPGPRSIARGKRPVRFDASSGGKWPESKGRPVIDYLGELRTDGDRLVVLGGHGTSRSTVSPPAPLDTYANNPHWLDDVSDGPVTATVVVRRGRRDERIEIGDGGKSWVIVGPPDFAPEITSAVTLWDVLCDMAARKLVLPRDHVYHGGKLSFLRELNDDLRGKLDPVLSTFRPDYVRDVFPILDRAVQYRWVHARAAHAHANFLCDPRLASPSDSSAALRQAVFDRIRPPDGAAAADGHTMPRLLGDEPYEDMIEAPGRRRLALTRTQYAILRRWVEGEFVPPRGKPPIPGEPSGRVQRRDPTPVDLNRAALEACSGGAFYPGIEVGWQIRHEDLFIAPFRIRHGASSTYIGDDDVVRAGHFTRQMALPWQADFADCKQEQEPEGGIETTWGWWPAQRPDEVPDGKGGTRPWTRSGSRVADELDDDPRHRWMVVHWAKLGFVMRKSPASERFVEVERDGKL